MRILMLSDYFPPHAGGGVERVVDQLSSHLVRRGHQVRVLTLRTRPGPMRETVAGVEVQRVPAIDVTRAAGMQIALSWQLPLIIWRAVREFRPDVIHAHNLYFRTTESMCIPQVRNGSKLVTTIHLGKIQGGNAVLRFATSIYDISIGNWIVRRSDRLIAVSGAVADHARSLGARPERVDVIPNGVDLDVFRPSIGPTTVRPRILFVGRLVQNKGPEVLVRAAPGVLARFPDAEFVFCGDGPMRSSLERETRRLGIAHAFEFKGLIDDVASVLRQGTVLVRPSTLEGMPLSVLEAMACGLPVVATRVGGTPELVKHGEHGFLFAPGDADALAGHLLTLLTKPEMAASFGRAARRAVEAGWSWGEMARSTETTYERALSAGLNEARFAAT